MKLFFLLTLLFAVSCDSPRYQQRYPGGAAPIFTPDDDQDWDDGWPDYDYGKSVPEEIRHCNWDEHAYTSPHLGGEYTLCQSKNSETNLFVKLENVEKDETDSPIKMCFFPVNIENGENTLVGAAECQRVGSGAIHRIVVSKHSQDAPSINGVIVVKDKLYKYERPFAYYEVKGPWAFSKCMDELKSGNSDYCRSFREKGEYLSHQF